MKKYFYSLLLLVLSASFAAAQTNITTLSEVPAEFVRQMVLLLKDAKRPDCDEHAKAFEKLGKGSSFSVEKTKALGEIGTKMIKLNMRPFPAIDAFARAIMAIEGNANGSAQFDNWIAVTKQTLDNNSKKQSDFVTYLNFSEDLFARQAFTWIDKLGPNWIMSAPDYQLLYENKQPCLTINRPIDLRCVRKEKDSVTIKNTKGIYYPISAAWRGETGSVDWERAGLGKSVNALFGKYSVDCKKSAYKVDTVQLSYPSYFTQPIQGRFEENVELNAKQGNTDFPRFQSFQNVFNIDNLGEGVKYYGGFKLYGTDLLGPGTVDKKATIRIYNRENKLVALARSTQFTISKGEKILTEDAEVSLYFGTDSIFHPDVRLRYNIPKRELQVGRSEKSSSKGTFADSYHQVDIDVDDIQWFIDSTNMNIGKKTISYGSGTETQCRFESNNFFSEREWVKHQAIATKNPVAELADMSNETERTIDAKSYAAALGGFSVNAILPLLQGLVQSGFIYYDYDKELITVKDKVEHYADSYVKLKDYDVLRIISSENGINGKFNTSTNNIAVNGVKNILVSDSAQVIFEPIKGKVNLKKNRDMDFGGSVYGGYGVFLGRKYHFNYDQFDVDMDTIDVFNLRIPTGDFSGDGTPLIEPLKTNIEDTNGKLSILESDDKSAAKYIREREKKRKEGLAIGEKQDKSRYLSPYPMFEAKAKSHAYYDHKYTEKGCYKRDSFYFHLEPFTIDSLHNFDPRGISFDGNMVSAKIFPDFQEKLRVQADKSLGFTHTLPEGGYQTYQGKAKYQGTITLDNKGLQGKGSLDYLTSNFKSDSIIFRPKSMSATAERFDVAEDRNGAVKFPKVEGKDVAITWKPYDDDMEIASKKDPFRFFGQEKYLRGVLHMTSKGLEGSGRFEWEEGIVDSKRMKFGPNNLKADTANIGIKSLDTAKLAFSSKNVKIYSDFDNENSKFESNAPNPISEMPYNEYITTFDKFDWNMKNKNVAMSSGRGLMGKFISVASNQDSLSFSGTAGNYDLSTFKLVVEGVPFIKTADAQVYPKDGKIIIQKNAQMEPLVDAQIIADTLNRYHVINRANVQIQGKKRYHAAGFYEYNVGDRKQEILFSDINATQDGKKWVTKGSGTADEKDNFLVDKRISYKGIIKLAANDKNLTFDGFAKINSMILKDETWFSVNSPIDRKNVVIQYDEPKNPLNEKVFTEIRMGQRSTDTGDVTVLYPLIMRTPLQRADRVYFGCKGALKYVEKTNEFRFGDSVKVATDRPKGEMITYNDNTGKYVAEGKLRIGELLAPITADIAGTASGDYRDPSLPISFDLVGGFKLPFINKALEIMANDIAAQVELKDINYNVKLLNTALPQLMDEPKAKRALESAGIGLVDMPKDPDYTFFFGKMPMKFNPDFKSFICDSLGLTSMTKKSFNKKIGGFLEIRHIDKGGKPFEVMHLYIEPAPGTYYYFNFEQGVMSGISSNPAFNTAITSLKKKEGKVKVKKGKISQTVQIELADDAKRSYFVGRMRGNSGLPPEPVGGAIIPIDSTDATPPADTTTKKLDPFAIPENDTTTNRVPKAPTTDQPKKKKEVINTQPPPMPVESETRHEKGDWLKLPPDQAEKKEAERKLKEAKAAKDTAKKAADDEVLRLQKEAADKAAENDEIIRKAAEEAAMKKAVEEADKKAKEDAAKKAADDEALRLQKEAIDKADNDAKAIEEAARKAAEEAAKNSTPPQDGTTPVPPKKY